MYRDLLNAPGYPGEGEGGVPGSPRLYKSEWFLGGEGGGEPGSPSCAASPYCPDKATALNGRNDGGLGFARGASLGNSTTMLLMSFLGGATGLLAGKAGGAYRGTGLGASGLPSRTSGGGSTLFTTRGAASGDTLRGAGIGRWLLSLSLLVSGEEGVFLGAGTGGWAEGCATGFFRGTGIGAIPSPIDLGLVAGWGALGPAVGFIAERK